MPAQVCVHALFAGGGSGRPVSSSCQLRFGFIFSRPACLLHACAACALWLHLSPTMESSAWFAWFPYALVVPSGSTWLVSGVSPTNILIPLLQLLVKEAACMVDKHVKRECEYCVKVKDKLFSQMFP